MPVFDSMISWSMKVDFQKPPKLQPARERRKVYEQNIPAVYEILRKGSEQARKAAACLNEVRKAMKIDYLDDSVLIAEHARKYSVK